MERIEENTILTQSLATDIALATDLGALKRLRNEIEDTRSTILASQSLWPTANELLNSLQHDLRTQVGNILACVYLLETEHALSNSQTELVSIVEQSADKILSKLEEAREAQTRVRG